MSSQNHRNPEMMSIEDYISQLDDTEAKEVEEAGIAIDIARLLYRAREARHLSQTEAAQRAEMRQQAISRLERPGANIQLATLQRYLHALGFSLEFIIRDEESNEIVDHIRV